jgi:hypothetical protein
MSSATLPVVEGDAALAETGLASRLGVDVVKSTLLIAEDIRRREERQREWCVATN